MKVFTAHTRVGAAPVLVREGFCWSAALLGPLWLMARRAWIAAILAWAAETLVIFAPAVWRWPLGLAIAVGIGLFGRDLWRWSLQRRGFLMAHVLAGRDEDEAFARLLDRRPDLIEAATR